MKQIHMTSPLSADDIKSLDVGDFVLLSGVIYTARDLAHKRLIEMLNQNISLPFDIKGQTVYYAGPCPAPPGKIIGSAGPTTSSRMDKYSPRLIQEGLRVMIGKGSRNQEVIDAIHKYKGIYFSAIGGTGALMSLCVKQAEVITFKDLGTEAIYKLTVEDMPLIVSNKG